MGEKAGVFGFVGTRLACVPFESRLEGLFSVRGQPQDPILLYSTLLSFRRGGRAGGGPGDGGEARGSDGSQGHEERGELDGTD